mmetsp:Transcript_14689/g.48028  ORF Transcript_14689/g.48028 Transcript_14689/m.48028 type:complete len:127 (+) Transcript_14689:14-394(+)|eukprot:scaffold13246_cov56-Isochrysis_galbana.AAC.1
MEGGASAVGEDTETLGTTAAGAVPSCFPRGASGAPRPPSPAAPLHGTPPLAPPAVVSVWTARLLPSLSAHAALCEIASPEIPSQLPSAEPAPPLEIAPPEMQSPEMAPTEMCSPDIAHPEIAPPEI